MLYSMLQLDLCPRQCDSSMLDDIMQAGFTHILRGKSEPSQRYEVGVQYTTSYNLLLHSKLFHQIHLVSGPLFGLKHTTVYLYIATTKLFIYIYIYIHSVCYRLIVGIIPAGRQTKHPSYHIVPVPIKFCCMRFPIICSKRGDESTSYIYTLFPIELPCTNQS